MAIARRLPSLPRLLSRDGEITVTPEELSARAEEVRIARTELQNAFDQMRTLMGQTANYWKGEAAEAHREGYNKKLSSIEEILDRYEEHIVDLEKMAGVYQEAETKAANLADELPAITL